MNLYDIDNNKKLTLYCMNKDVTVNDGEIWKPNVERTIRILTQQRGISWTDAMKLLIEAEIDSPVEIDDDVFWTERESDESKPTD